MLAHTLLLDPRVLLRPTIGWIRMGLALQMRLR